MSAFEVAVTPPRIKNARNNSAIREPTQVVLALFSAKSTVTFEDIPVTKTAKRYLHVHNPTDDKLKVLVTKLIKPEANAKLEWTSNEIPAQSYVSLEIVWNPLIAWSSREIIQFTDNRNFKKDVAVILKSVDKNAKNVVKKSSVGNTFKPQPITKKLVMKSPSPRTKQKSRLSAANGMNGATRKTSPATLKKGNHDSASTKRVLGARNNVCQPSTAPFNFMDSSSVFSVNGKENLKPTTPKNVSNIFDTFKFTPITGIKQNGASNLDFLASLPTPSSTARPAMPRHLLDPESPFIHKNPMNEPRSPSSFETSDQNRLNTTTTIDKTPKIQINDQTTTLYELQTPGNYSVVDSSQVYEYISNCSQYAAQNTPGVTIQSTYNSTFKQSTTSTITKTPEAYIQGRKLILDPSSLSPHLEPLSETMEHVPINRTHVLSSPAALPQLPMIEEEYSGVELSETYVTSETTHQRTYNVVKTPTTENLVRDVNLVGTPLHKKYQSMRELSESKDNMSLEQKILKLNQGSMPNLHKLETVKSIENNRYFYQSIEKDLPQTENEHECLGDTSICSMKSTVSTQSVAFKEHEILAQSSRFNLNEIGKSNKSKASSYNQPVFFTIDKPINESNYANTSTSSISSTSAVNKNNFRKKVATSNSQPIFVAPKSRESVITYVGKQAINSTPNKKRVRDENNDSFKKSLTKQSPPKRVCMDDSMSMPKQPKGQSFRTSTWGATMPKKFLVPGIPTKKLALKKRTEERVILFDPELHMRGVINPDPFAATTTYDPFLAATMYLDEECVDKHETQFKRWLNALVTIPGDGADTKDCVDVGKLFNEVRNKQINLAPTKETVSSKYLTKYRLDSLRHAAIGLYTSNEMRESLEKLLVHIERRAIHIRQDRNLHLDVVLQRQILELLLNFNPLWLRIGMEVVFGEQLHMNHNLDVVSLSSFILNRLFRDRYKEAKHARVYAQSEEYAEYIKKFTLKKFLCLIYFLDVAKNKKIIKHNPCLFCKTSEHKETKDILLRFSSTLLGNVGDIQRDLKRIGIVLTHKQNYIDEFDYAFRNLAIDLRDGVRLTKVMEVILLREDLTCQLRAPAISRTQRVHNVGVALKALQNADYNLTGKITAADIADGHREKTLSLLWQIIYRFRAPKFNAAATVIQNWWRQRWLSVVIRRRIQAKHEMKRHMAACVIQSAFRGYLDRKYAREYFVQRTAAAVCIQSWVRSYLAMNRFKNAIQSAITIQRWYRGVKQTELQRNYYLYLRSKSTIIQRWYRTHLLARRIQALVPVVRQILIESKVTYKSAVIIQQRFRGYLQMKKERKQFLQLKQSTIKIQQKLRASLHMRKVRDEYLHKKSLIITVQTKYRAYLLMKKQRKVYVEMKTATQSIQQWYRACCVAKKERCKYLELKKSTVTLQRRFRALKLMQIEVEKYQTMKKAALTIQQAFRANIAMKEQRAQYQKIRSAAIVLQSRYKAKKIMELKRREYLALKQAAIIIQQRYRAKKMADKRRSMFLFEKKAAITIQQGFRAKRAMVAQREKFLDIVKKITLIQQKARATASMKRQRKEYLATLHSIVIIQRRFRAKRMMNKKRTEYLALQLSAKIIQTRFRAELEMRKRRAAYLKLKFAALIIQQHWRANLKMLSAQKEYVQLKSSVIFIQRRFRALVAMKSAKLEYDNLRRAATFVQTKFRTSAMMKAQRNKFLHLKKAAVTIQRRYRANKLMQQKQKEFQELRQATINVQRRFRANISMMIQHSSFLCLRQACVVMQTRYRAQMMMRKSRQDFIKMKQCAVFVQRKFRANMLAKKFRLNYQQVLHSVILVQRRFRANRLMRQQRSQYEKERSAIIILQRRFRANLQMSKQKSEFVTLKWAAVALQRRFRARRAMKIQSEIYTVTKKSVFTIQQRLRATITMRKERASFVRTKNAVVCLQRHIRAFISMRQKRQQYLLEKNCAILIQRRFRGLLEMRRQSQQYLTTQKSVVSIQRYFRGYQAMKAERKRFLMLRAAAIVIQQRFIANKQMLAERQKFLTTKSAVCKIQTMYRAFIMMKVQRESYLIERNAAITIQKYFRLYMETKRIRAEFLTLRENVIRMQQRYRAQVLMKKISNQYKLLRCLAICLQRKFRANLKMRAERVNYLRLKDAACVIQRRYRAKQLMLKESQQYSDLKKAVLAMQSRARGMLARRRLQMLMTPELIEARHQNKAAKTIQSFWRGYLVRKTRAPRLRLICEKVKRLQKTVVKQNIIRNRIKGIIRFLKHRFNVNEALYILRELESISRSVPHTLIPDAVFIAHFCYGIMSQAIRSEVDKQLIGLCCRVLLNLARYKPTRNDVFQIQNFETVAQILARWCDKDCDIFNVLCTVIWVFAECPIMNQQIRDYMVTPDAIFLLREAKKLVIRKDKMRKTNPPPWMPILTVKEKRTLPMLDTNFGVITGTKNYIFNCAVFAFERIVSKLNINL